MTTTTNALNLSGAALTPGAQRGWWLREALTEDPGEPCPPLARDVTADVVIVGGGFSGLWTAYFLTERNPNLGIVVLEQDICGGGPSGRNGGFASGWWDDLHGLVTLYGQEAAVRACRAIAASIRGLGEVWEQHGIDAWYRRGGYMYAITAAAHDSLCEDLAHVGRRAGAARPAAPLPRRSACARSAGPAAS